MEQLHIREYLDNEHTEAVIEITYGDISLLAYDYPHTNLTKIHDYFLTCFVAENIHVEECWQAPIHMNPESFEYYLVGRVISCSKRLVHIGNIKIYLDSPIPGDVYEGNYIGFNVVRLDFHRLEV